jgi:hypothetical protein
VGDYAQFKSVCTSNDEDAHFRWGITPISSRRARRCACILRPSFHHEASGSRAEGRKIPTKTYSLLPIFPKMTCWIFFSTSFHFNWS